MPGLLVRLSLASSPPLQIISHPRLARYDALTTWNIIKYQNSLTAWNIDFALAAGSILTNYAWTPTLAERARTLAAARGLAQENVYFGLDVWAQNVPPNGDGGGRHQRTTWPRPPSGGGTGTGLGVAKLAALGFSAGVFAPGWPYEHFGAPDGRAVDRAMWEGQPPLPADLPCECAPIGVVGPHAGVPYERSPILRGARAWPAGTEAFFHTDLRGAFRWDAKEGVWWAQVAQQAPGFEEGSVPVYVTAAVVGGGGPSVEAGAPVVGRLHSRIMRTEPVRQLISLELEGSEGVEKGQRLTANVPLVTLGISTPRAVEVWIRYRVLNARGKLFLRAISPRGHEAVSRLLFDNDGDDDDDHDDEKKGKIRTARIELAPIDDGRVELRRLEIGLGAAPRLENLPPTSTTAIDVLEIFAVTIQPADTVHPKVVLPDLSITHGRRVTWAVSWDDPTTRDPDLPWSAVTGPCAFFEVKIGDSPAARTYAVEYYLSDAEVAAVVSSSRGTENDGIEVAVAAFGFDRTLLGQATARLPRRMTTPSEGGDDAWVWVEREEG